MGEKLSWGKTKKKFYLLLGSFHHGSYPGAWTDISGVVFVKPSPALCRGCLWVFITIYSAAKTVWDCKIKPSLATSKDGEKKVSGSPWWVPYWTHFEFFPRILGGEWPRRKRDFVRESKIHLWIPANLAQWAETPLHSITRSQQHQPSKTCPAPNTFYSPPIPVRKEPEVDTGEGVGRRKGRSQPWTMFLSVSFTFLAWNGIRWEKKRSLHFSFHFLELGRMLYVTEYQLSRFSHLGFRTLKEWCTDADTVEKIFTVTGVSSRAWSSRYRQPCLNWNITILPATQLSDWFSVSQILYTPQIIPFLLKLAFYCLPTKPPPLLTQLDSFYYLLIPPFWVPLFPKEGEQLEAVKSGFH